MKLSDGKKLILVMLSDIHEALKIDSGIDPNFVREAIHSGNAWGLRWKYPGTFEPKETSEEALREVLDVLEMQEAIEHAYQDLSPADKERVKIDAEPFGDDPRFRGFDGNNESEHLVVADFLINELDGFT